MSLTLGRVVHYLTEQGERMALVVQARPYPVLKVEPASPTEGVRYVVNPTEDQSGKRTESWHWPERV